RVNVGIFENFAVVGGHRRSAASQPFDRRSGTGEDGFVDVAKHADLHAGKHSEAGDVVPAPAAQSHNRQPDAWRRGTGLYTLPHRDCSTGRDEFPAPHSRTDGAIPRHESASSPSSANSLLKQAIACLARADGVRCSCTRRSTLNLPPRPPARKKSHVKEVRTDSACAPRVTGR